MDRTPTVHRLRDSDVGELIVSKQFCTQLMKAFVAETSCNQLLIDSATYLLTINSPTLKSVAMSLYDIDTYIVIMFKQRVDAALHRKSFLL